MDWKHSLALALVGVMAGLFSGTLGVGGGAVIIPSLVLFLGFSQQSAQGTTLAMMVLPIGILAAVQYYQNGFIDTKAALIMAVFFMIGGYFGAKLATQVPEAVLRKSFAALLIAIALKMWFQK